MTKYEVQFFSKVNQWVSYRITDDPQIALDIVDLLNSIGDDARVITYEVISEVAHEYYVEKEA